MMAPRPIHPPTTTEDAIDGKRLTPRSLRVLAAAAEEAEHRSHNYIGTEHLLIGLVSESDGIAARVLDGLGVAEAAKGQTRKIMDSPSYRTPSRQVFNPGKCCSPTTFA